jgi:hypothetical protein
VTGTFVVQLFSGNQLAMFMVPCVIGEFFILPFAATLRDRRLAKADKPTWSLRQFASTFYFNPRKSPDFGWAFASRFMFVLAYAFLTTYQAYFLLNKIGSAQADAPQQIPRHRRTVRVLIAASLIGGRLSDRTGRRKIFVLAAAIVYGLAMFASPSPATSTVSWSAWRSPDSASGCTWRSTSRLSPTYFPTLTPRQRISACSTSPARYPPRSRRHPGH